MNAALLLSAGLMGLAGSLHCTAMCGAATLALGRSGTRGWAFQAGRLLGYGMAGAVAAGALQSLQWAAAQLSVLKPFWAMFHVAVIALGLSLLWRGRQPHWLDALAHHIWQRLRQGPLRRWPLQGAASALVAGLMWVLLPCGLLYSALMVAALGNSMAEGAAVMLVFALASAVGLQALALTWQRLRGADAGWRGTSVVRAAGAILAASSAWALGHGLWMNFGAPVCR